MTYALIRCTTRSIMHVISREREENASLGERVGADQGERRAQKGAKRYAKPAGCCRAMTPRSVYGCDVDQLYATYARIYCASLRNARTYLP